MTTEIDVTEPQQLALATRPVQAVEAPQAPLWGTSDSAVILAKATATANSLKDVVRSRGLISNIKGKEYPRCEAWTLLGTLLGVFPVLCWTRQVDKGWEARVEAKTLSGAVVGAAEAQCLYTERNWSDRDDFALRSMAQTRATAKALRMPLGFVMTLAGYEATPAEEMTHVDPVRKTSAQRPAASPLSAPAGPALPKGKTVESLLEASRTKVLQALGSYPVPQVWAMLLRRGAILPTESVEAVTATALFPTASKFCGDQQTQGTYEAASKAIKGDHDELMIQLKATKPTPEEAEQFDKAHSQEQHTEPWWDVICPIPHKNEKRADYEKNPDTIRSLYDAAKGGDDSSRSRLFGFANKWKPEPRTVGDKTYQPSAADLKFRDALDSFLAWEEAKGSEGAEQMRDGVDIELDGPPF